MKKILAFILTAALVLTSFAAAVIVGSAADNGYITDGLVADYNASKIADGSTTWTDASGNGNDIPDMPNTDTSYFKNGVYTLNTVKIDLPDAIDTLMGGEEFTVELVLGNIESLATSFNTFINCPSDDFSLFRRTGTDVLEVKLHPNPRPMSAANSGLELMTNSTITVTFKAGGNSRLYVNGKLISEVACNSALANTTGMFFGHDESSRNFNAEYKAMRFYSRELTAEEIKANYAVDGGEVTEDPDPVKPSTEIPDGLKNVALGKSYTIAPLYRQDSTTWTWSDTADIAYPDEDGITLTDGNTQWEANTYSDPVWMGFNANTPDTKELGYAWMNVDLGKAENVKALALHVGGTGLTGGIKLPSAVEFFVSNDGENWNSAGTATLPEDLGSLVGGPAILVLDEAVSAKYVQARVSGSGWMFVSEFEAYAEGAQTEDSSSEPSSEKPVPPTSDNGIVALAVIASLAIAGAVIVKKSR